MPNLFVISDHHFDHANILTFSKPDGTKLRPQFKDVTEMNEFMVQEHNKVVRVQDKVYILGDVSMNTNGIKYLNRLNGHKRLVLGNHDHGKMKLYQGYVEAVYSSRRLDKFLLTHIPIHPLCLGKALANIHGHEHGQIVVGKQYFDVSVECLDYRPIEFEVLKKKILKQLEDTNESGV